MNKVLVLMHGLLGGGKSTLAQKLAKENNAVIYSTDNFWLIDGEYKFDFKYLGDAHRWNQLNVLKALRSSYPYVIVDNTNLTWAECEKYVRMAFDFDYEVAIVEPDTPWKYDVEECFIRGTHGVPKETLEKMLARMESTESIYNKITELSKELNVKQS
jgi:NEDD4-binding protein 2